MNALAWRIATRYLRGRRSAGVSFLTLIAAGGVTVGVMALLIVLGAMNGLQRHLRERILVATPHVRLLEFGPGLRMDGWRIALDRVRAMDGVVAAAPFVLTQGLLSAGADFHEGVMVIGLSRDTGSASVTSLPQHLVRGTMEFETTRDDVDGGIILGRRVAERFSAFPGTVVSVISPGGSRFNASLGAFIPRFWTFESTGYFETGMYEYDNGYTVLPLEVAQRFAGLGDAVTGLEIRLEDPGQAVAFATRLEEELQYPYRALDWQTQNGQLFAALRLEKLVFALVVLLIVIVAAFNIVSMLTMVVTFKTKEIGILRAMGFPAAGVRRVFQLQGLVIGGVGTMLGLALGIGVSQALDRWQLIPIDPSVYFIDHLPIDTAPLDVVLVAAASLVIALVATLRPAQRAADLVPVEAIRHE